MKKLLFLALGVLFLSGVALAQNVDGVELILEAARLPKEEVASFTTLLEQEIDELYLQGRYAQALEKARYFIVLGLLHNDEVLKAHFSLFTARALAREKKESEAFAYLTQAYQIYGKLNLEHYQFLTLETLARVATNLNYWEEAKNYLAELEKLAQKRKGMYQEMYLFHRGVIHFHENLFDEARKDWEEAEKLPEFYPETRGLTLNHMSRVFLQEENPDKALEYAQRALSFSEERNLRWVELVVRLNLAQILSEYFLKEDEALKQLQVARQRAEEMDLPQEKVWALNNQAVLFTRWGEYGEARKTLQEALEIQESHHMPWDLGILTNLGVLSFYLGDMDNAKRYLQEAYEEAFALKDQHSGALILGNLGMVYKAMGKLQEALPYYEHAYRLLKDLDAKRDVANLLNSIASLHVMTKDFDRAEEVLQLSRSLYETLSDQEGIAQVEVNLGYVRMEKNDLDGAQDYFERALQKLERSALQSLRFYALLGLGELELKRNEKERAFEHLYEAVGIVEKTRNRMEEVSDRICFTQSRLAVYEFLIEALFGEGKIEEAFNLSERVKARSFLDVMVGQSVKVKAKDMEVMEKIKAWEREKAVLATKKAEGGQDEITLWKVNEELAQVEKKLYLLYEELKASSPELLSLVTVSPLSLAEMQKSIPEDVVVVDYFVLPERTFAWIITTSTIQGFDLPVGENVLYEKVSLLREKLANPKEEDFVLLTNFLCEALFTPLEEHLQGKKKVLLIPHRSLSFLPFQVLTQRERYLLEEYCFFYVPSLNTYFYALQKEYNPAERFLGFGNPKFSNPDIPPLPGAEEEVREIGKLFPNPLLLFGKEATESAFYQLAKEASIVHLSTHGSANERSPLYSTIFLAPDSENDGLLLAGEIFFTPLQANLVVLSACETALGQYSPTEGLIGFTRSFFYAGTPSLIASL
ncbi:MAG: CHAT domain-containing protein, partial [Candidatus Atribacteria bacterium]|nr:CHAT domain-containing protein [Candidatus Atribacteria bacterium]